MDFQVERDTNKTHKYSRQKWKSKDERKTNLDLQDTGTTQGSQSRLVSMQDMYMFQWYSII